MRLITLILDGGFSRDCQKIHPVSKDSNKMSSDIFSRNLNRLRLNTTKKLKLFGTQVLVKRHI